MLLSSVDWQEVARGSQREIDLSWSSFECMIISIFQILANRARSFCNVHGRKSFKAGGEKVMIFAKLG